MRQEAQVPAGDDSRYDLIIIGSGPAGHHAAIQAAKLGHRVAVVERQQTLGGVCINTGTIPSKTLREGVLYLSGVRQRGLYGGAYRVKETITIQDLRFRCYHVMQKERDIYRAQFLRNGVTLLEGHASFVDRHTVRVDGAASGSTYQADHFIIATGTSPASSPEVPVDGASIIDADGVFALPSVPKSMIVVGGGVIGIEYACIFATLGVTVTVVDGKRRLLDFVDAEIAEALLYHMRDIGVTFRLGESMEQVEKTGPSEVTAHLASKKMLRAETLLYAVGRHGNTAGLGLAAAGLAADERGRLQVDDRFRTPVEHIYAVGDVVGFPALASVSMEQGRVASADACGVSTVSLPGLFPYGLYTIPEISFVGPTEEQLTAARVPYEVGMAHYREIARGEIIGDTTGRLKLLFHAETGALLGVHIVGEGATELVHIGQAVIALGGTIRYFVDHVFNYPTLAECYKVAALAGINKLGPQRAAKIEPAAGLREAWSTV
jgi:NAD(P) transhydrogenase